MDIEFVSFGDVGRSGLSGASKSVVLSCQYSGNSAHLQMLDVCTVPQFRLSIAANVPCRICRPDPAGNLLKRALP